MNDNFGERILQLRIRLELTQKELARLFDVASLTVSRWERNKSRPMPVHLRKMERLERKARKINKEYKTMNKNFERRIPCSGTY